MVQAEKLQLNSIHCNPLRPWQFVVGGSDIFARVYDQRRSLTTSAPSTYQPAYTAAAIASPVPPPPLFSSFHPLFSSKDPIWDEVSGLLRIGAERDEMDIRAFRPEGTGY